MSNVVKMFEDCTLYNANRNFITSLPEIPLASAIMVPMNKEHGADYLSISFVVTYNVQASAVGPHVEV